METDTIRRCVADYLRKANGARRQRAELQAQIDAARRKIAWHEKRMSRLSELLGKIQRPRWTDEIVVPVMAEVARLTPGVTWEYPERLNIHGLRAACSVFGRTTNGEAVGLTFTFDDDTLHYDTGEVARRFAPGTLGEINGMNNVSAPVESVDSLAAKVNAQITHLKT